MRRYILLSAVVSIAVAIAVDFLVDRGIDRGMPGGQAAQLTTAERFISARRDGESIPQPAPPAGQGSGNRNSQLRLKDCTAEKLSDLTHAPFVGTVTRIVDGDTLKVVVDGIEMRVRLWGVNAPELAQPNGVRSQETLGIFAPVDSRIEVHPVSMDRYGQILASVGTGSDLAVNFSMVGHGWAYHFKESGARRNRCLIEAQKAAETHRAGMWQGGGQGGVRPWDYRRQRGTVPQTGY